MGGVPSIDGLPRTRASAHELGEVGGEVTVTCG